MSNLLGIEPNDAEAVKWTRKAAEKDIAWEQNNLGVSYERGQGLKQDDVEAMKWFDKAIEWKIFEEEKFYPALHFWFFQGEIIRGAFDLTKKELNSELVVIARKVVEELLPVP